MPHLEINTNIPKEKVTPEILAKLSKALTETIGKPEKYCVVHVCPDQLMMFGGSSEPCATATMMSIGKMGVEENKIHSANIMKFVEEHLGISKSRMYITFVDKPSSEVGFEGTTFHQILGH